MKKVSQVKIMDMACDYNYWADCFDSVGEISEDQFDDMEVEEKIEMIIDCYGQPEPTRRDYDEFVTLLDSRVTILNETALEEIEGICDWDHDQFNLNFEKLEQMLIEFGMGERATLKSEFDSFGNHKSTYVMVVDKCLPIIRE